MAAFEQLVERHKQSLLNYTTRMLRDPTEAEDVAQNAFFRVFIASDSFRFTAHFRTWLFTIARNLCLNELRRRSRHLTSPLEAQDAECEHSWVYHSEINGRCGTAAEALAGQELQEKVEEALAELSEPQRTAILLLHEEGLSYGQIATILDKSVAATKSIIHRGRQALKSRLSPYLRSGDWRM
ncbi:MAG TPA: sigma-70 family RNA polymerase sigma factor [Verrucomicrobiae bacterium]|nr:sigma-70 family RNA polymerase sigma factor [Verrucomicrobiae bacterium]